MNKTSKTYQKIKPLAELILSGELLCIDPSTGSKSSDPGYALFKKGDLVESGIIECNKTENKSKRLYEISRTVREEFNPPDILAVEWIASSPHASWKGTKKHINPDAIVAIHKAIGAIIGALPIDNLLEIPASAWRHHKTEDYIKTDEWDAITIGLCCINTAKKIIEEDE